MGPIWHCLGGKLGSRYTFFFYMLFINQLMIYIIFRFYLYYFEGMRRVGVAVMAQIGPNDSLLSVATAWLSSAPAWLSVF